MISDSVTTYVWLAPAGAYAGEFFVGACRHGVVSQCVGAHQILIFIGKVFNQVKFPLLHTDLSVKRAEGIQSCGDVI